MGAALHCCGQYRAQFLAHIRCSPSPSSSPESPSPNQHIFYRELRPISNDFEPEALRVNGLDRARLCREGATPENVMSEAARWVKSIAGSGRPVLVAYPLSFDWSWLYWYFRYSAEGSPFRYSQCFDIKTALAVKAHIPIAAAGRSRLAPHSPAIAPILITR